MKKHRSLVRFLGVSEHTAYVVVPGWDYETFIEIDVRSLPEQIFQKAYSGFRCFAKINLDAELREDIEFEEWELPK